MNTIYRYLASAGMSITIIALVGCQTAGTQNNTLTSIDDTQMTAQVKAAIMNDAIFKVNQIRVETFNGVVQLSGTVGTRMEAIHVEEMTRTIKGVKDIRDNLEVR